MKILTEEEQTRLASLSRAASDRLATTAHDIAESLMGDVYTLIPVDFELPKEIGVQPVVKGCTYSSSRHHLGVRVIVEVDFVKSLYAPGEDLDRTKRRSPKPTRAQRSRRVSRK